MAQRGKGERGVDRGKPAVAGADAVAALDLQVIQELSDVVRVEVGDVEFRWCDAGACGGEGQQQTPGVAVGREGVRAGAELLSKPVGEEGLQCWRQSGHRRSCASWVFNLLAARANSSGAACRYQ